jgi:hypothetical protein
MWESPYTVDCIPSRAGVYIASNRRSPADAKMGLYVDEGNVVAVKYSKYDKELLGYFRACVAKVCGGGGAPGAAGGGQRGSMIGVCAAYLQERIKAASRHGSRCSGCCKHDEELARYFKAYVAKKGLYATPALGA